MAEVNEGALWDLGIMRRERANGKLVWGTRGHPRQVALNSCLPFGRARAPYNCFICLDLSTSLSRLLISSLIIANPPSNRFIMFHFARNRKHPHRTLCFGILSNSSLIRFTQQFFFLNLTCCSTCLLKVLQIYLDRLFY